MDHETIVTFSAGPQRILARFDGDVPLAMGASARIALREDRLHLFERSTGTSLLSTTSHTRARDGCAA
jgi:hypothetical protein